jgi:hypothetical protein
MLEMKNQFDFLEKFYGTRSYPEWANMIGGIGPKSTDTVVSELELPIEFVAESICIILSGV